MYSAPCGSMNITAINQKSVYTHTTCKPCNTKNTRNTAFHTSAKTKTLQQNHNRKKYIYTVYIYIYHTFMQHITNEEWAHGSVPLHWVESKEIRCSEKNMECEKGEVEMGGSCCLFSKSPQQRRQAWGDQDMEFLCFSWINEEGVVMNEPYLNILIAGFRADHSGSENKRLPYWRTKLYADQRGCWSKKKKKTKVQTAQLHWLQIRWYNRNNKIS